MLKTKILLLVAVASLLIGMAFIGFSSPRPPRQVIANSSGKLGANPGHTEFQHLLEQYVSPSGWVDYDGLSRDRGKLTEYLQQAASAQPASFSTDHDRLAFWINSYNAYTLDSVLDHVYGRLKGVREAPGFFDRERHAVAGEQLTLDQIEEHARSFRDPRVHFALVCASTSCPKLQRFAYAGPELDTQLQRALQEFIANPAKGLKVDPQQNRIYLSPIFKWYAGDFTGNTGGTGQFFARAEAYVSGGNVLEYVKQHAPEEAAHYINEKHPTVEYFNYDWSLNSQRNQFSEEKPGNR